jgi:hypothetical protein
MDEKWIVGEFNCSCVGISKCLPAYCKDDTPNACFNDIPKKDMVEVRKIGSLVGKKAIGILGKAASATKAAAAQDNLKSILKSIDPKLASNDGLIAKLTAWKRS